MQDKRMSDLPLTITLSMPRTIQERMIRLGDWLLQKWPALRRLA